MRYVLLLLVLVCAERKNGRSKAMSAEDQRQLPIDYAVYGAICAAKHETGPDGARRMYRIQDRINFWDQEVVEDSLRRLMAMGWIEQLEPSEFGFVYYQAKPWPTDRELA